MNRLRGYLVTSQAIAGLLRKTPDGYFRSIQVWSTIPDSAEFRYAYFEPSRAAFVVVLYDESFDEVCEGEEVPIDWNTASVSENIRERSPSGEVTREG